MPKTQPPSPNRSNPQEPACSTLFGKAGLFQRSFLVFACMAALSIPADASATDAGNPAAPSDPVAGRSHWAFQPFSAETPRLEEGNSQFWARSPIDAFILAGLRSAGIQPAADAPKAALLRRLHFQLTGLPPSSGQMMDFLDDPRPDALERVVDALLASPQFGERWGRHWLDLARYADSNGLDENFLFREAWRYRNWVIDAINADMPFDEFALAQIAGDALPFTAIAQRDQQRIASGFLVIGPKVLLGNDPQKQRMEVADEQIDTIGRTFLGLTLGCARCHDHKFEPVPRADYYALAGIFTSTQVMEQRYMLGEQRVMERLVGLGSDGDALDASYEKFWLEAPKLRERSNQAKAALAFLEKGDLDGLEVLLKKSPDALVDSAKDPSLPAAQRIEAQKALAAELAATLAKPPKIPPRAMIPADVETPADEAIRLAGQFDRPGDKVPRGFLQVLNAGPETKIPDGKSGRLELGKWLTDAERGAGRLAARVLVNRIWRHLIGAGIVRTADNFGRTGEAPSHPALLDYLAQKLIDSDWSVKAVVRTIVLSRTFALSADHNDAAHAIDPENRLLWRAHRRRLDPESLRDAMLSASSKLDLSRMDSTVSYLGDQATAVGKNEVRRRTDFPCRSVYLPVIRNDLPELFQAFDFADPHATTGARPQTTAVTQGLFLLNDRMVMDAAEALAKRLLHETENLPAENGSRAQACVDRLFDLLFNGPPTREEREEFQAAVQDFERRALAEGDSAPALRAWSIVCHAAFSLSRFQFLE